MIDTMLVEKVFVGGEQRRGGVLHSLRHSDSHERHTRQRDGRDLLRRLAGSRGLSDSAAAPFISGLHAALLLMTGASIVGFFFSALRGSERDARGRQESKL